MSTRRVQSTNEQRALAKRRRSRRLGWAAAAVGLAAVGGWASYWIIEGGATVEAVPQAPAASGEPRFVPMSPEPPRCARMAALITHARERTATYYPTLHSLQADCPRTARQHGLAGQFFPQCTRSSQVRCTAYRAPQWYASIHGRMSSFRILGVGESSRLRASRATPDSYAFVAANAPLEISTSSPRSFTLEARALNGRRSTHLRMALACSSRNGSFLTYAPISSFSLLGPARGVMAPDERGNVVPSRQWRRFGGVVPASSWPKRTASIRPQIRMYPGAGSIEVRLVSVYAGASPASSKRVLKSDLSFAPGVDLLDPTVTTG